MSNDKVMSDVAKIVSSQLAAFAGVVALNAAMSAVKKASVTNSNTSSITGESGMHPTNKETNLAADEASASKLDSSLANEGVEVQKAGLSANETAGKASQVETTAVDAGATASKTQAGASEVDVKALKVM